MPLAVLRAIALGTLAVGASGLTLLAYSEGPMDGHVGVTSSTGRVLAPDRIQAVGTSAVDPSAVDLTAEIGTRAPARQLFQAKGCGGCHALAGVSNSRIGPDLTNLPRVAASRKPGYSAEAYVRESILDPQAYVVPGFGAEMPRLPVIEREADILVEFLLGK